MFRRKRERSPRPEPRPNFRILRTPEDLANATERAEEGDKAVEEVLDRRRRLYEAATHGSVRLLEPSESPPQVS